MQKTQDTLMDEWYIRNNTTCAHCPAGCDHPQPIPQEDGTAICGRCAFVEKIRNVVLPGTGLGA